MTREEALNLSDKNPQAVFEEIHASGYADAVGAFQDGDKGAIRRWKREHPEFGGRVLNKVKEWYGRKLREDYRSWLEGTIVS